MPERKGSRVSHPMVWLGSHQMGDERAVIRYLEDSDAEALQVHVNGLYDERKHLDMPVRMTRHMAVHEVVIGLHNMLMEVSRGERLLIGGFAGKVLAGTAALELDGIKEYAHVAEASVIISKGYRGKGLGTALLRALLAQTNSRLPQIQIVRGVIHGQNLASLKMAQSLGMTEYGRLDRGARVGDHYEDVILVRKEMKRR